MAIDGRIADTRPTDKGIEVELEDWKETRVSQDGTPFTSHHIAGQSRLLIEGASWTPHVGDKIWGGKSLHIVSGGVSFPYKRKSYTTITEDW